MNYSIYGADRLTHLKIVVVGLVGAILVAGVSIAARGMPDDSQAIARAQDQGRVAQGYGPVVKAGAPVVMSVRETSTIR
jgi:hypothetical protein